jgi:hypothetical protein
VYVQCWHNAAAGTAAAVPAGNTLEGFGIVTLASLLPVLAVELMAILTGAM